MRSKALPKSRAKTAYGLLSEIAALGLAEPKRIQMGIYLHQQGVDADPDDYYPACGTVGCIAGWTCILKSLGWLGSIWGPAMELLGLNLDQANELFHDESLCAAPDQQTKAHAKAVAKHIHRFQKKYAAQLKAKKV